MTPCSRCARHVRHHETTCPFCGTAFVAPPARTFAVVGRVTRAAVFSAALVACSKPGTHDEPVPAPHAGSAEKLDQDFNQLLGSAEQGSAASGSAAVANAADAAVAPVVSDAAQVAVPVDAMSDEERTRQLQQKQDADKARKHAEDEKRREHDRRVEEQRLQEQQRQLQEQQHYNAKPYGAPPARRRVV